MDLNLIAAFFSEGKLDHCDVVWIQQIDLHPLVRFVLSHTAGGELNSINYTAGFPIHFPSRGRMIRYSLQGQIFFWQEHNWRRFIKFLFQHFAFLYKYITSKKPLQVSNLNKKLTDPGGFMALLFLFIYPFFTWLSLHPPLLPLLKVSKFQELPRLILKSKMFHSFAI